MFLVRFFLTLLLAATSSLADAGLPFTSETVDWDEEVLLADGQHLKVYRSATYGPDGWGRSGRGRLKKQAIHFFLNGKKIKWVNSDGWPISYMPEILDINNGVPVLVMPVHRWGPCEKFDFPQEGLVTFVYRNGSWERIPLSDLPKGLKVNLLRGTHAIRYWDEYRNKRITPKMKQDLERANWGSTKQGQSIAEASKFYSGYEDSCARIRPLPQPQLEIAKKVNFEAETHALQLVATITSTSRKQEMVSPEGYRKAKGRWTGSGYLADSCQGVAEKIEPIRQYRDGGGWSLIGHTIILKEGRQVPLQQMDTEALKAIPLLDTVACDKSSIYAIKRKSNEQFVVHRFTHSGALLDALLIKLPEADKFFPERKWGSTWDVVIANGDLGLSLVEYSYTGTVDRGGFIEQRLNYTVQLPPIHAPSVTQH